MPTTDDDGVRRPLISANWKMNLNHFEAIQTVQKLSYLIGKDDLGTVIKRPFRRMIPSDYVELPDYDSLKDLTPANPMAAGVLETARGCTESCTYCEVIQQFVGYRMVKPETELKRIAQLQQLE